ncbi:hypothetical protein [Nocardia sp. CC201C]|uniref:hypothetical protein n=1 Tax=Nocardia sp. CC201C TaxID=3044575 RepID=UPI0024A88171|nr:hypothetical protein [Nocardia sp. CC201C]
MSRGQLARTPANFPRMKYRARKRHRRAQLPTPQLFAQLNATLRQIGVAVGRMIEHAMPGLNGLAQQIAQIQQWTPRCDICQGTGDSNGADWCTECEGTGYLLPDHPEPDTDDEDDDGHAYTGVDPDAARDIARAIDDGVL